LDRKPRWLADLDERSVEQYLRHRAGKQSIQPGDRSALKRWLSVLRAEGVIAPAVLPPLTSHDRIFNEFDAYLRTERGLAPKSIVRHLPVVRRFLHEVCPAGDDDCVSASKFNHAAFSCTSLIYSTFWTSYRLAIGVEN
jgi:hypothetical protein